MLFFIRPIKDLPCLQKGLCGAILLKKFNFSVYNFKLMNLIYRKCTLLWIFLLICINYSYAALSGKEIYQQYCSVCHASGLAGAPKYQSKEDWSARLKQKHLQGLVDSAIKGINAMPAKGTCQACLAADIREAIKYMVPENEK